MAKSEYYTAVLTVSVTPEQQDAIRKVAAANGLGVSAFVRSLLLRYLKQQAA